MDWAELMVPTVSVWDLIVRGTITFLGLMLLFRLVGRREAGGLGMTDLLVILLAVDAASSGLLGESESLGDSAILVLTVVFWSVLVDALSWRWPAMGTLFKAPPRPIIQDGRLNHRAMRRELMSSEELESQLRLHGVHEISEVERAFIEPNGMVSIVTKQTPSEPESEPHPDL